MIKKNKPMSVAIDIDDVLFPCMSKAIDFCNEKYGLDMTMDEITGWLPCGGRVDVILECFKDPNFFATQEPYPGAQEFIAALSEVAEVYPTTAIPLAASSIRGLLIKKFFPQIPEDHIILTTCKNMVHTDILLDDGSHNILNSPATYPVLMRRPWNKNLTGVLSVNNYDEFLSLFDQIRNRYVEKPFKKNEPAVVVLVGPSGTGKTTITEAMIEKHPEMFEKPKPYTTRAKRDTESNDAYNFVCPEKFKMLKDSGEIFESTIYSGNSYGSSKTEVEKVLSKGKNVIIPLDMCGAIGMKTAFDNVIIIYVDRHKRDLLTALLSRNTSIEDKVNRIISLPAEEKNSELCDFIINNDGTIDNTIDMILEIFQ